MPVEIVRNRGCTGIVMNITSGEGRGSTSPDVKEYAFIWHQTDYLKIRQDEILWIEAVGSYSSVHMTNNRSMIISFHLAVVERSLPDNDFVRIHRSHVVNLRHVSSLIGNSLNVGGDLLTIGREYRNDFYKRFVFLGVRGKGKT